MHKLYIKITNRQNGKLIDERVEEFFSKYNARSHMQRMEMDHHKGSAHKLEISLKEVL